MNGIEEREVRELLRGSVARVSTELRRDLWPEMLRRLDDGPPRVPWVDWALVGAVIGLLLLFPEAIPVLIYHL